MIENFYGLPPEVSLKPYQRGILTDAKGFVINFFKLARQEKRVKYGSHGQDHNFRVAGLAGALATLDNRDPFLPILAGEIHDVGRAGNDPRAHDQFHGQLSVELAFNFVDGLTISQEEKMLILQAVGEHPFMARKDFAILGIPEERQASIPLVTIETETIKYLQDADRLDGIGPITPIKVAAFSWDRPLMCPDPTSDEPLDVQKPDILSFLGRHREWGDMLWTDAAKVVGKPWIEFLDMYRRQFASQMEYINRSVVNLGI